MKPPSLPPAPGPRPARFFFALLIAATISFGAEKTLEKMRGVDRGKPAPPAPTLIIGVNDAAGGVAEPGWPLIVSAVRVADDTTPAAALPANLRLKVTGERGAEIAIEFTPVPRAADDTAANTLHWIASESATRALAPGRYRVTGPAEGAWRIESGAFQVVASDPERAGLLSHLRMKRSALLGQTDEALAEADRLIGANDKNQAAWIAKGDLLMKKDQPDGALEAYDRALGLQKKTDREPIAILVRRRTAITRSLEKRGVLTPK